MNMKNWIKTNKSHFIVIGLFIAICLIYFNPAFLGKSLGQNDVTRAQSTQTEINAYKQLGETILWTNQIHGGMPTFQIWAPYPNNLTTWIVSGINHSFPQPVGTVLLLLVGSYFLFLVLRLNPWLAATAAIGFTFSSYNIILLTAGHANQVFAIAFFAPVIAGILLIFKKKYLLGTALTSLFIALEIRANHVQMTYYLMIVILILVAFEGYHAVKAKETKVFLRSITYAGIATFLAITVNASSLWSTYEYGEETIRGHSNLTQKSTKPGTGLPKDYAYQWSQGVAECFTFLIPNIYGGGSRGQAGGASEVVKTLTGLGADKGQAISLAESLPLYWGNKPFTEGPIYFGAVICFLFVLALLIVKDRFKWWLITAFLLTAFLSFGKNWPYISDLFFDYFPLYNKFRAVESILAVTALCFIMLAALAMNEVINETNRGKLWGKVKIAFYISAGVCLVIAFIPDLFLSFKASDHQNFITQLGEGLKIDNATANAIGNALVLDRKAAAQSDAVRSLIFITLGFSLLWAFLKSKLGTFWVSIGLLTLVLIDMWSIDKRYLNFETFTAREDVGTPQLRDVDKFILKDKDPNYKVIDINQSILSDATTPYFHKSFGGYSAVRLKRFDELVEVQFKDSINHNILGMLNTKYVISRNQSSPQLTVSLNPSACGHAWFVNNIKIVQNADQEMEAIGQLSPKKELVVHQEFIEQFKNIQSSEKSGDVINLVRYSPDHMIYQSESSKDNIAVFSEIYYPKGWKMFIDGIEKPYFRANYILRAAKVPAGRHKVEFIFHPNSYYTGEKISLAGSFLLVILLAGVAFQEFKIRRKSQF